MIVKIALPVREMLIIYNGDIMETDADIQLLFTDFCFYNYYRYFYAVLRDEKWPPLQFNLIILINLSVNTM